MQTTETLIRENPDLITASWGDDAPRGGKIVMGRIMKEKATVPLFFAQTLIQSLRDVGYDHTTSALCEQVDNSIQAGANEIRVFFKQTGKRGNYQIDVAVYDNGQGMSPSVLKVATAFGGSMNFGNRNGIARFGMGMKTAALSMSPVMELYSWQESKAIYNMTLDIDAIGRERANLVELPDAGMMSELPSEVSSFFTGSLSYPTDRSEQTIVAPEGTDLYDQLGPSGTIVYMPVCDRLTYATAKPLVDHAVKEMARVYRRQIAGGLSLYINNRLVEAFDPTYSMPNARHAQYLENEAKQSNLIVARVVEIPIRENSAEKAPITIKLFRLPIEDWSNLPRKTLRNNLRVFDNLTVSILRNDREVYAGSMPKITTRHSVTNWYRVQIDFPGKLDEAFGVASNKQGVRLKGYVEEAIKEAIGDDISNINAEIKRFQGLQAAARIPAKPSTSEARASEADAYQSNSLVEVSADEQAQLDANLRGLALTLKRDGETEDEAFERVRDSKYIITMTHDTYWPFYDVAHRFGRVILTINTAHPFFTTLYEPLTKLMAPDSSEDEEDMPIASAEQHGPILALDLLLLSLARTQSRLGSTGDEAHKLLDNLRREWSDTYRKMS
jgi:hypothetical protein